MSIERLSGGLTPADGSDPRTFPEIFNGFADEFEGKNIPAFGTAAPSDGQVLTFDSASSEYVPEDSAGGASSLEDLTDTDISSPSDGDALVYDGTSGEWVAFGGLVRADGSVPMTGTLNFDETSTMFSVDKTYDDNGTPVVDNQRLIMGIAGGRGNAQWRLTHENVGIAMRMFMARRAGESVGELTIEGNAEVTNNLDVLGSKNARIRDPLNPEKFYRFGADESPHGGRLIYDFHVKVENEPVVVDLPEYLARIASFPWTRGPYAQGHLGQATASLDALKLTVSGDPGQYVVEVVCARADLVVESWQSQVEKPVEAWAQPEDDDGYRLHAIVAHKNNFWQSIVEQNVSEPGVSGWRLYAERSDVKAWVKPTGGHAGYAQGDKVAYKNRLWKSDFDNNALEPPEGWSDLGELGD